MRRWIFPIIAGVLVCFYVTTLQGCYELEDASEDEDFAKYPTATGAYPQFWATGFGGK